MCQLMTRPITEKLQIPCFSEIPHELVFFLWIHAKVGYEQEI